MPDRKPLTREPRDIGALRRNVDATKRQLRQAEDELRRAVEDQMDAEYPPITFFDEEEREAYKLAIHDGFGFVRNASWDDLERATTQKERAEVS